MPATPENLDKMDTQRAGDSVLSGFPDPHSARIPLKQLASLTGLSPLVIRAWERRYGFPSPARTEGGHRRYTAAEVDQVRRAATLARSGLRAADAIASARAGGPTPVAGDLSVAELAALMVDHDPAAAIARLRGAAIAIGIEATIEDLLMPAMRLVGEGWEQRRLTVAEEHVATGVAMSWLGSARGEMAPAEGLPVVVVATLEGEDHALAVWALEVLLRSRGVHVRALGGSVPVADIAREAARPGVRAVVVAVRRRDQHRALADLARAVGGLPGAPTVHAGGPGVAGALPGGIVRLPATLSAAAAELAQALTADRGRGDGTAASPGGRQARRHQ